MNTENQARTPPRVAFLFAFAAVYFIWGSTYLAIRVAVAAFRRSFWPARGSSWRA